MNKKRINELAEEASTCILACMTEHRPHEIQTYLRGWLTEVVEEIRLGHRWPAPKRKRAKRRA